MRQIVKVAAANCWVVQVVYTGDLLSSGSVTWYVLYRAIGIYQV